MTVSIWQEIPDPIQAEHDDVVIGAGIVGSYTATCLHERGRDVALVDARFPAAGASGRNAGFVLTAQRESYPDLIKQVGRDIMKLPVTWQGHNESAVVIDRAGKVRGMYDVTSISQSKKLEMLLKKCLAETVTREETEEKGEDALKGQSNANPTSTSASRPNSSFHLFHSPGRKPRVNPQLALGVRGCLAAVGGCTLR